MKGMVIVLSDPQIWIALGIFAAALATIITVLVFLMQGFGKQLGHVEKQMMAQFETIGVRISALDQKFELKFTILETKVNKIEQRLEEMDTDIQAIAKKVFPE